MSEQKAPLYTERKNSGLGIASFVTSVIALVLTLVAFAVAGVMEISTPASAGPAEDRAIGYAFMGLFVVHLVAIGLGIAGFFEKETKKTLAILGTVFSSGMVVLMKLAIIYGASLE